MFHTLVCEICGLRSRPKTLLMAGSRTGEPCPDPQGRGASKFFSALFGVSKM